MIGFGPRRVFAAEAGRPRLDRPARVAVVGGGIAGVAAATILAERGAAVDLVEREPFLGGRAGGWTERLRDGTRVQMERGFHGFFRQYYNLRRLLRRIDPGLRFLRPLSDYPILGPHGAAESFAGLPRRPPFNVLSLVRRSGSLRWRDVLGVDKRLALEMLAYDPSRTYARFDGISAAAYLDALGFPPHARQMLFDVFSHSFFNPEETLSAAELLMQFHFYFMGNPEGLVFDVVSDAFSTAVWEPLGRYLAGLGVRVHLGRVATRVAPREGGGGWRVALDGPPKVLDAEGVVLAVTVPALRELVAASPALGDTAWRRDIGSLEVTWPFAVWRLWLDRPTRPGRAPFVGTAGLGRLDNISLFHLFEEESRAWARRTGGAVVELHAYAVPPDTTEEALKAELMARLRALYPETRDAGVVDERFLLRRDCPAFPPGTHARRPGVATPAPGVALAGDLVRLPFPSALMERAAASGVLAANHLLGGWGVRGEPVWAVPGRGLLARWVGSGN